MSTRTWLAFFLLFSVIVGVTALGAPLHVIVDFSALLILVGALLGGTLLAYSTGEVRRLLRAWTTPGPMEPVLALGAAALFRRLSGLSIGAGMVGLLVGLVPMIANLDDPTLTGPAMAVAVLSLLYGVVLSELVFRPVMADCLGRGRLSPENSTPDTLRKGVRS